MVWHVVIDLYLLLHLGALLSNIYLLNNNHHGLPIHYITIIGMLGWKRKGKLVRLVPTRKDMVEFPGTTSGREDNVIEHNGDSNKQSIDGCTMEPPVTYTTECVYRIN
jgi:hypothetical protein